MLGIAEPGKGTFNVVTKGTFNVHSINIPDLFISRDWTCGDNATVQYRNREGVARTHGFLLCVSRRAADDVPPTQASHLQSSRLKVKRLPKEHEKKPFCIVHV